MKEAKFSMYNCNDFLQRKKPKISTLKWLKLPRDLDRKLISKNLFHFYASTRKNEEMEY